ncbi:unnamed protein product [Pseudo-nitzschia multistriata]|uniref:Uncharacterized protein n=1 Tax=Pseudo-nitzschia multistriata TaxID=183589 RepID=A0A448ZFB7_9STRA|nr:unnamed protein product [Pseudo-nitzschia multistriata]
MTFASNICWHTIFSNESAPIDDVAADFEYFSEICSRKTTQYRSLSTAECVCGKQHRASSAASDILSTAVAVFSVNEDVWPKPGRIYFTASISKGFNQLSIYVTWKAIFVTQNTTHQQQNLVANR